MSFHSSVRFTASTLEIARRLSQELGEFGKSIPAYGDVPPELRLVFADGKTQILAHEKKESE